MQTNDIVENSGPTYLNRYRVHHTDSPLLFMHLTKTAGGTLKDAFREAVPAEKIQFHYPHEPGFSAAGAYDTNLAVVFGHFIFGIHHKIGGDARYACILREPVTRNLSHYFHLRNVDRSQVGDAARDSDSFVGYIEKYERFEFDNFYVRMVSGIGNKVPFGKIGRPELDLALDNLRNHFVLVGSFDAFADTVAAFGRLMSRQLIIGKTVNKGRYGAINIEDRVLAAKLSAYDLALYRTAREIFDWDGAAARKS